MSKILAAQIATEIADCRTDDQIECAVRSCLATSGRHGHDPLHSGWLQELCDALCERSATEPDRMKRRQLEVASEVVCFEAQPSPRA